MGAELPPPSPERSNCPECGHELDLAPPAPGSTEMPARIASGARREIVGRKAYRGLPGGLITIDIAEKPDDSPTRKSADGRPEIGLVVEAK